MPPMNRLALLLAIARQLIASRRYNREFVRKGVNWDAYLEARRPELPRTFESFEAALLEEYAQFTPEYAAAETGVAQPRLEVAHVAAHQRL